MGDFLTRLAERTLGVAPLARPDLAPVFAPEARAVPVGEVGTFGATTAAASNPIPEESLRHSPPSRVADGIRHEAPLASDRVEPGERTFIPTQTHGANVQTATANDLVRQPEALPRRQLAGQIESVRAPAGMNIARESLAREFFPHPGRTTHASALDPNGADSSPATVNITIGRIEVRALSQPQAARPAEPRAKPLRSLEGYLRERNGGRG